MTQKKAKEDKSRRRIFDLRSGDCASVQSIDAANDAGYGRLRGADRGIGRRSVQRQFHRRPRHAQTLRRGRQPDGHRSGQADQEEGQIFEKKNPQRRRRHRLYQLEKCQIQQETGQVRAIHEYGTT